MIMIRKLSVKAGPPLCFFYFFFAPLYQHNSFIILKEIGEMMKLVTEAIKK